jgi:hypothetical protein
VTVTGAPRVTVASSAEDRSEGARSPLPESLTKVLGAVVAPTSMVTALLYFFGWSHAYWFFHYLGVDSSLLGFGTTDYLMRSMDALFVPMIVAAIGGLVALWGHTLLRARLVTGARPRLLRVLLPVMGGAGLVLATGGLWSAVTTTFLSHAIGLAPFCLAGGVCLLVYALRLRPLLTGTPPAGPMVKAIEWVMVLVLVGLSAFWAEVDYSAAAGQTRARQFVAELPGQPAVVLYSEKSLSLAGPGITVTRCHDPRAAYPFRYDGLRLVTQPGDQYLLLPARWSVRDGMAILLPRSDSVRLEFAPMASITRPVC